MMSFTSGRLRLASVIALLAASSAAHAQTDYFWNITSTTPTGGGAGNWDTTNQMWSNASNVVNNYIWQNTGSERANFGNTAGTVTLSVPITAYGINFSTANYVVTGSGANILTLSGPGGPISSGVAATISAPIAGSVGLTKTGGGALTLNAANTYSGTTTVTGGTLIGVAQTSGSPFSSGAITLNESILNLKSLTANTTTTTVGDLTISAANANAVGASNLTVDNTGGGVSNTTTFAAGNLVRGGAGSALVITPQTGSLGVRELITFTGGTTINNGILSPWTIATTSGTTVTGDFVTYGGSGVGVATYSGTLATSTNSSVVNQSSAITLSGAAAAYALKTNAAVNLGTNTLTLGNGSGQSGLILNNGAAITNGNITFGSTEGMVYSQGTTTLGSTGNNIVSNGLTVTGLGATTMTINGNITDNGATPAKLIFTGATSASGLVLNGTNTYTGGTTIGINNSAGGASISAGSDSAFGTGKVTNILLPGNSSPLMQATGADHTLANAFDMNGGLTFNGSQSLSFNGPINIIQATVGGSRTLNNTINTAGKSITYGSSGSPSTITLGNPVANGGDGVGKTLIFSSAASSSTVINDAIQDPATGGGTASGTVQYSGSAGGVVKINSQSTYSGPTLLGGSSTVQIASDSVGSYPSITSGPFGVGTLTPNNGTNNIMQPVGGDRTVANAISMNTGFTVSNASGADASRSLKFTGPITLTSTTGRTVANNFTLNTGGTLTLGDSATPSTITGSTTAAATLTFSGNGTTTINDVIQDATGVAAPVTISAGGGSNAAPAPTFTLNAQNTYTGGTTLSGAGTLVPIVSSSNALPGASFTAGPFGTGALNFNNGTNQHLRPTGGNRSLSNAVTMSTGFAMDNATGETWNLTFAGPISMSNSSRFVSNGFSPSSTGGNMILGDPSAPSTITTTSTFTLSVAPLAGPIVINDVIQGPGNITFDPVSNSSQANNNPTTIDAQNTYSGISNIGNNTVASLGLIQIGVSSVVDSGSGAILSGPFGTGNLKPANTSSTPAPLTPFGADRTVANAVDLSAGNLGAANAGSESFNLNLTGAVSFGNSTASRSIFNNMAGSLILGSSASPSTITLGQNSGLVLTFGGQNTSTTVVNDVIQNGPIPGNDGNVAVTGSIVNLKNANTYTGTTTVTGGSLLVNNTSGSGTGSGNVSVSGGTLGGSGTISGSVSLTGGAVAPGNSAGALSVGGNVTFASPAAFNVEIGGTTPGTGYDQLLVAGGADLTAGGNLNVSLINGFTDPLLSTDFTILSATGGVTGIFSGLSFPDANWSVIYNANSVVARFTAPPMGVPGDYNGNGVVDAADYVVWRKTKGQTGAGLAADGNHDNVVNDADYDYWRARFGNVTGSGALNRGGGAVPEPGALSLLVFALGSLLTSTRPFRRVTG